MDGKQEDGLQGFQGVFTPGVRRRMRNRRKALGLSMQQLGETMGVNWSTLRKWEDGTVGFCRPFHARKLSRFLAGELDDAIQTMSSIPRSRNEEKRNQALPLLECMERISGLYRICEGNPALESAMVSRLNEALRRSAERIRKNASQPREKED
ncbi:MAG: helix-turn-helix domain-containing protein [Oligosphaeraceae bacterium]